MTLPRSNDSFTCPNCGAEVPPNAKACPECGADEKTGWSHDTIYDGTDIEDPDEFDYEDWKRREVEGHRPRRTGKQWFWWAIAIIVLAALLWLFVVRQWCALP
ncbi:MAG TPA: zinc ribbon domain-containing protein [Verrucomicrobiae bacterium]|nr:zinc ribbon domain-containing protein [Verrucomicrobiae bacterium]